MVKQMRLNIMLYIHYLSCFHSHCKIHFQRKTKGEDGSFCNTEREMTDCKYFVGCNTGGKKL